MKIPITPVMVTGSTGYVGGVLVKQLLKAGLTVHCPVRDPTKESKLQHLKDLDGSEKLKFFKADLLTKGSYLESMKGCSVVFHLAAPFITVVPKDKVQEVLLDPSIKGALNVLESANAESSIKRVVMTSSIAAIVTDGTDCEEALKRTGKMCNEETWNESATETFSPYALSKTMAEKSAWAFMEENDCSYELAVCNPSFVLGPGVKVFEGSESYAFMKKMGDGTYKKTPDISMAVVDVRDVARGHMAAGFLPSVTGERYILNGANTNILDMGKVIFEAYPDYPLPSSRIPKWLIYCIAPLLGQTREYVSRSVGTNKDLDNAKSLRKLELGEYTPLAKTLNDMFKQCVDNGFIPYVESKQ
uniref:NAD-dependent epimerase/dehydratase domain-containing protein n=1 Tax=Proboscia inermis TaxID=420281 RepID=A0A7S0GJ94_9STRA|mmetsp:Transcript_47750/g.48166  ORF Transcript_47750/g.48166 Transcript_47750/m.48166 type:complete len:359 (+) Transcript_47750:26-1102(+)|eukprot:CAMPEP_0171297612 /NCGR_PEP_ID=MMETSP0816-20121228/6359_1 /TAXON_ID=420281 /ORGANISM="Proboscia inermis, Strain CCAP1064/1" /LENGTH=358 /DNA_ID=CAMNT_0011772007 /DNA_START=6 /DNA_END=1082 /DNA_ORIENTATION=-